MLEEAGFECELLASVPGRPNLAARLGGRSDGPRLCYPGHIDTVLADASDWSGDPWSGALRDDCAWGRGARDIKSQGPPAMAAPRPLSEGGWRRETAERT